MKKLLFLVFAVSILASCKKEPCNIGTITIKNTGTESVTIYSISGHPSIEPLQTISETIDFCQGGNIDREGCPSTLQIPVSFKFDGEEMTSKAVVVGRCQTELLEISN